MVLNQSVFEKVRKAGCKILVVTKYWNEIETKEILNFCEENYADIFFGLGENRIENLERKRLPREKIHFIGNIQSKKITKIVKHSSTVHSLESLKHAELFNKTMENQFRGDRLKVFLQIKLDSTKELGILPEDLDKVLGVVKSFKNLEVVGISGMGNFSLDGKKEEFLLLKKLRDQYLPMGKISAGTSHDFEIALEQGICVVRVGRSIVE